MAVVIRGPEIQDGQGNTLITLDASISQTHERSAIATEHPVEEGADITDHVQPQLPRLTIAGVYSAVSLVDEDEGPGREIDAWTELERIIDEALPVSVITTLRSYDNMILLRCVTERNGRQDIRPTLELRQVRIIEQQVVTLPPERIPAKTQRASAPSDQDTGRQPTDAPTAEEEAAAERSLAALVADVIAP